MDFVSLRIASVNSSAGLSPALPIHDSMQSGCGGATFSQFLRCVRLLVIGLEWCVGNCCLRQKCNFCSGELEET